MNAETLQERSDLENTQCQLDEAAGWEEPQSELVDYDVSREAKENDTGLKDVPQAATQVG